MTPGGDQRWTAHKFLAVDLEGNGRRPPDLVELAIVSIAGGIVAREVTTWLVRPAETITWRATTIHGIRNRDVEQKPRFEEIESDVRAALGVAMIVGHRVLVDFNVLRHKMANWEPQAALDTWALAKAVLPDLKSYSLKALIDELSLEGLLSGHAHRADYDALAAAHLFTALARRLDEADSLTLGRLLDICAAKKMPPDNPQRSLF